MRDKNTGNSVMEFLRSRPAISITAIEKEVGCPAGTFFRIPARGLPKKWHAETLKVLARYGYESK